MSKIQSHYLKLRREYIFPIIEQKLAELKEKEPSAQILNLGIGDVALPLAPKIVSAICEATKEMGNENSIHGYGPSEGYSFLREAIAKNCYAHLNIGTDEIFISDGINGDITHFHELFSKDSKIAITDPTYPAYLDTSIMAGASRRITFLPCLEENGFCPLPPKGHVDLVYLCSPNNPTGIAMNRKQLSAWVDYAIREQAVLLVDSAYASFVTSPDIPKTIYEIEGAKEVAVEFCSFSKSAGFTGLRCGHTVVPKFAKTFFGKKPYSLNRLWTRHVATKFNGVAYPIQKGALAVYSDEGKKQTQSQVASYLSQAKAIREGLSKMGHKCFGGVDSPYIWWKVPPSLKSWEFFDLLLEKCHLISIPGSGFGPSGEGYIRLSGFTTRQKTDLALNRIQQLNV